MSQEWHNHGPRCFIVPPHILRSIAQGGTPSERTAALKTLATDSTLRAMRSGRHNASSHIASVPPQPAEVPIKRIVCDAQYTVTLPGSVARLEGAPPTNDPAVDEAYDGFGATFGFFAESYDRVSIDDEGLPLRGTVHFDRQYDNAFWNGDQMVFGDGDGQFFERFTIAVDVIAHELTHGVTEDEAHLVYFSQAGALNESISDVFGSLVKQRLNKQSAESADWLIGAGLFTERVNGAALRSMSAPGTAYDDPVLGKDPQPSHMRSYVTTFEDNGGVHINSGIPNHAFYLSAIRIGGHAWERAGRIWYETLRDPRLRPNTGFRRFARLTLLNASRLYGDGSAEHVAVRGSWNDVGLSLG